MRLNPSFLGVAAILSLPVAAQVATAASPVRTIAIAPGYGVTILTGQPVYKVWIDDGSKVGVDFDRPPEEGATIIHVYQPKKPKTNFSADGNTMMTLVTGSGDVQKIKIQFSSQPVKQTVLDLTEGGAGNPLGLAKVGRSTTADRIKVIRAGLQKAVSQGRIAEGSALYTAVTDFLSLMSDGISLQTASDKTGVQLEVIGRLAQLGVESSGYKILPTPPEESQVAVPSQPEEPKKQWTLADFRDVVETEAVEATTDTRPPDTGLALWSGPTPPVIAESEKNQSRTTQEPDRAPDSIPTPVAIAMPDGNPQELAAQIERGLERADRTGDLKMYSTQGIAVQKMLQRMRWGESLNFASQQTGVTSETTRTLLALGKSIPQKENPREIANALVRGLSVANATGEIGYTAYMSYKVQDVVRRLRRGNNLATAVRYSNVPQKTVDRLLQLGSYQAAVW